MANPKAPKAFISYSWSSLEHESWVIDLAASLVESGVEIVFDKWDLKEGHDSIRFMEQMVTDPTVTKVIIISDKKYVAKADGRLAGVGTETQIISAEIYASVGQQDKFAVVVSERDENGKAYLPTYYKGRIYIDLSDESAYSKEHERLLRWLYDKPVHVRPPQGNIPGFLLEGEHKTLGTSSYAKRAVDALAAGRSTALGAFTEYLTVFNSNLERFRIKPEQGKFLDDQVVESLAELLPAKNEFLSVLSAVALYSPSPEFGERLHSFLENMHEHTIPPLRESYEEGQFDNFRFLIHELFLSSLAMFIKHGRTDLSLAAISDFYLPEGHHSRHRSMVTFAAFVQEITTLDERKRRTESRQMSLHADMLIERLAGSTLRKEDLIQADMILFLRAQAVGAHWYPETFIYIERSSRALEAFARSSSRKSFEKIAPLLGIESPEKLAELIQAMEANGMTLGRGVHRLDLRAVTALDELGKKP